MVSNAAVEALGLVKRYAADRPPAVDGLTLHVGHGEVYGLLGRNGSGKSTTVGMLATLLAPTAGRALVAGHDVVAEPAAVRRRIGVTLQETGVDPQATGRELLALHAGLLGLDARAARRRADALLDAFDLAGAAGRRARTYSGGMRRRLDLALALVGDPAVVFLDEPTTGLDPLSRLGLWEEVRRLRDAGTAVLLTTLYLAEADRLADRVGILADGRLRVEGPPEDLKRRVGGDVLTIEVEPGEAAEAAEVVGGSAERDGRVRLEVEDGGAAVPRAIGALERRGLAARSVALARPTLDDVFLQVVGERLADEPPEIADAPQEVAA